MSNILDYLQWRGDLTMLQVPLNEIDALILSQTAYFLYENLPGEGEAFTFREVWEHLKDATISQTFVAEKDRKMLEIIAESERFQNLRITHFRGELSDEDDIQFAAVTIILPDGTPYIAFRGTDHTLVGWKEDLHMAFSKPVPAQICALHYLTDIVEKCQRPIVVSGHSKGGNLALFSAVCAAPEVQQYIQNIYIHDGPGLTEELFSSEGYYRMRDRLCVYLPEKSVVGILLMHPEEFTIVKSSANGIMQHDPYSWQLLGTKFEKAERLQRESRYVETVTRKWREDIPEEQLHFIIDTVFGVLESTEANTLDELIQNIRRNPKMLITILKDLDEDTRKMAHEIFTLFAESAIEEAASEIREKRENLLPWKKRTEKKDSEE